MLTTALRLPGVKQKRKEGKLKTCGDVQAGRQTDRRTDGRTDRRQVEEFSLGVRPSVYTRIQNPRREGRRKSSSEQDDSPRKSSMTRIFSFLLITLTFQLLINIKAKGVEETERVQGVTPKSDAADEH
ncbi:hypothetical protein RUM44_012655 [Polyplax serrata]|uniref:Uncharacterized protein n=1 Tax=Polyplax serrata TaxID=468196 RepID=A0ABR1BC98_POLSC